MCAWKKGKRTREGERKIFALFGTIAFLLNIALGKKQQEIQKKGKDGTTYIFVPNLFIRRTEGQKKVSIIIKKKYRTIKGV